MKEQDEEGFDHWSCDQGVPVRHASTANFDRPGRFAMQTATCLVGLLMLAIVVLAKPTISSAQVAIGVTVTFAPPALPIYIQPLCPGPDYIWVPGYWAWDPDIGYYWVPGTWVLAPFPGALWTPGYWAWDDGVFIWYEGYWGPVVGFYGGIDYGFGYTGFGYDGGYWRGGTFYYNRAVNNVSVTSITTVYSQPVTGPVTRTRVSYNGGPGGTTVHATAEQLRAARQRRSRATAAQRKNIQAARRDRRQRAVVNRGRPPVAATPKAGKFTGRGIIRSSRAGAQYQAPPSTHGAMPSRRAGTPHPPRMERQQRLTAPKRPAPPSRIERHVVPRNERAPGRRAVRPVPERRGITPRPEPERREVTPRPEPERRRFAPPAAPEQPERPRQQNNGERREEGMPR